MPGPVYRLRVGKNLVLDIPAADLSPRAAALLDSISDVYGYGSAGLRCRSVHTRREQLAELSDERRPEAERRAELFAVALDEPDEITITGWPPYRPGVAGFLRDADEDPADYAERLALHVPRGYYPVGYGGVGAPDTPTADAARQQVLADLISAPEAATLAGIKPATWRAYVSRNQAPAPIHPGLWDRSEFQAWLADRPRAGHSSR